MPKAPHHSGSYHRRAAKVRAAAWANPDTRCWRCHLTIAQIHQDHPRAKWTAGHLVDGQIDGTLLPECSPCNYSHGARTGNAKRKHTSQRW